MVFRGKMWEKMAKRAVSLETRSYFFFLTVFSETRPTKMAVFTCYLGIKAWNAVVVFIETRGFCYGGIHWNQGILARRPSFTETVPQKKIAVSLLKPYNISTKSRYLLKIAHSKGNFLGIFICRGRLQTFLVKRYTFTKKYKNLPLKG